MNPENIVPSPGPGPHPGPVPLPESPILGTSNKQSAVTGTSQTNIGVLGQSVGGPGGPGSDGVLGLGQNGVHGQAYFAGGNGVLGESYAGLNGVCGKSVTSGGNGVLGEHSGDGNGVTGQTASQSGENAGVYGLNTGKGPGVYGKSDANAGVVGKSTAFNGGWFESSQAEGLRGVSHNANHGAVVGICVQPNGIGVFGFCDDGTGTLVGTGVFGKSSRGEGVHGETSSATKSGVDGTNTGGGPGISANSQGGPAVSATSQGGIGVVASGALGGVFATSAQGTALVAQSTNGTAGEFNGPVRISGDLNLPTGNITCRGDVILAGGDCAEEFDATGGQFLDPGTVVAIGEMGAMRESSDAYDKRVAGVICGAGNCKPGIVLGRSQVPGWARASVALVGKVYCKVDARYSSIEMGDLLTTSPTPGHAMKATDPVRAFGAVIGKALEPLDTGEGLVPILVALQ